MPNVTIALTKIRPCKDALHWMFCCMTRSCSSRFIACCTQVIIVAYEALIAPATKVSFQTRITANT